MLEQKLTQVGLSVLESKVYSTLIRRSGLLAGTIAKKTNLSRSTVYSILDSLIKKGLISVSYEGRIKYFITEDLEKLEELIKQEELEITKKKQNLKTIIKELTEIKDTQNYIQDYHREI